jgi:predicted amidohydrolase
VALPEYFCLMGRRDDDKLRVAEAAGSGPIQQAWPTRRASTACGWWAARCRCAAATPGTREQLPGVRARRQLAARYDKIHLFAFDNGRERYDEGRTLDAGRAPVAVQAGPLRVGLSICYDLRFPELYRALMTRPATCSCVPAAFTYTTGQAHWELLLRARAVENQCYVLAAAQGGTHENGRRTWGHSMVVDPWGEVLACQAEGEGVVMAEVDPRASPRCASSCRRWRTGGCRGRTSSAAPAPSSAGGRPAARQPSPAHRAQPGPAPGEAARQEVGGGDGAPAVGARAPIPRAAAPVDRSRGPAQRVDQRMHVAQAQVQALAGHRVQRLRGVADAHDAAVDQRALGVQAERKVLQRRRAHHAAGRGRQQGVEHGQALASSGRAPGRRRGHAPHQRGAALAVGGRRQRQQRQPGPGA